MTPSQYRQARLSMGLTRVQLAERLDCGLRTVERCEAEGCSVVMGLAMERLAQNVDDMRTAKHLQAALCPF